ncbi:MAG: beta-lactamase family protein [Pirellulales bacterium]|nr:beta-lactamase family protein [Pirellulales bacterium]
MKPDEFQKAWQADAAQTRVTFDVVALSKEVRRCHQSLQSTIFWRDIRETAISLLMLPLWFFLGIRLSLPWTWYLTVPALVWVTGFIVWDRRRHPQRSSEPGEPLLFYVKESLSQVEHQIWLLRNVFWWYLLPFSISIMAFFLQITWQSSSGWLEFVGFTGCLCGFLVAVYWGTYRLNQRAVREQLQPRRRDLLKLVASLESESTSEDSSDVVDLVSALNDPVTNCGLNTSWADNWNLIIPSWRTANLINLATAAGALCGLLVRKWVAGDETMPKLFAPVVGAVIAFEISLAVAWLRSRRQAKQTTQESRQTKPLATEFGGQEVVIEKSNRRPRAAAIFVIALLLFVSLMACLVLYQFVSGLGSQRSPELEDINAFSGDDQTHIDAWLKRFVDGSTNYPSLSAVVVRDGQVVYRGAFGFEDIQSSKKATPQTQYHVASVTKVFTATVAVILHQRGVVDLDQPVVTYLPENVAVSRTPDVGATITLRQLASHTSGLPRGVPGRVQSVEGWYQLEPQRLYEHLADVKLEFRPGTAEEYSNLGFGLLGHALELAANKPFDQLMQELVCAPLDLKQTAIQADETLRPATGYGRRGRVVTEHSFTERLAGSGGLVTSVDDLGMFLIAQMNPGVFSRETLNELHAETKMADGTGSGNALGWSVRSRPSVGQILKKNGGRSNCSAWLGFAPEHNVGVAIITNCGGPDVDPLGYKLLTESVDSPSAALITQDGYAKVAPYNGVRWENDLPIVRVRGQWSRLVSIDGIPIERIMEFARAKYGEKARKRFAEDLVQLLFEMGHAPRWDVTLGLRTKDGVIQHVRSRMTDANRMQLRN